MPIVRVMIDKDDDGIRLDRWFKRHHPNWPFAQVARLARTGQVRMDGKRVKVDSRIEAGLELRFPEMHQEMAEAPKHEVNWRGKKLAETLKDLILHMDDNIIVLNKPYGLAVQGGSKIAVSLDDALEFMVPEGCEKPRLVHRLDRETSGLILLARSARMAHLLTGLFQKREMEKSYLALLTGVPSLKKGTINYALSKEVRGNFENMRRSEKGVSAITDYEVLDYALGQVSLVKMWPRTGRMHQLRVHSQILEHPILGDHKYRLPDKPLPNSVLDQLHLVAHTLAFEIEGKEYNFTAPIPAFFQSTMKQFGLAFSRRK